MARVTHVKAARQRYATIKTGEVVAITSLGTGEQKTTKHGKPVVRHLTEVDYTHPLPNRKCESCGKEITVGSPYKWVAPKSGPYGGTKRFRCAACPTWQPWDLSSALWARIAQIQNEAQGVDTSDAETVKSALESAADQIEELADEKEESGNNLEEGFGHETEQSTELKDQAENLRTWAEEVRAKAEEIESAEEDNQCESCEGSGTITTAKGSELECPDCTGTGEVPEEDRDTSVLDDALAILDESPV